MDFYPTTEEGIAEKGVKIKVIGCGGGGGNMINHMIDIGMDKNIDLIVANTDIQPLQNTKAKNKIQLGERTTKGLGAGMKPEIGAESAKESFEEIKEILSQSDVVFIAAGLGGGTGTGASPIVARAAKEVGALTVSVVTMPFNFEGSVRTLLAEQGLEELKKESDSVLVIKNEQLRSILDKKISFIDMFKKVDDILATAVQSMSNILLENIYINVDYADLKTIMSHRGLAFMGIGYGEGGNAYDDALNDALNCPLLHNIDLKDAKALITRCKVSPDLPGYIVFDGADNLKKKLGGIPIIAGMAMDPSIGNKVELTIIATGFDSENNKEDKKNTSEKKDSTIYSDEELNIPTYLRMKKN